MKNNSTGVVSLLLNLVIPGLGSVIGGKANVGVIQLVLTALAGIFVFLDLPNILIGAVAVSAWLWALMTSIELLQPNKK